MYLLYRQEQQDRIITTPICGFKDEGTAKLYCLYFNKVETNSDVYYFLNEVKVITTPIEEDLYNAKLTIKTKDFEISTEDEEFLKKWEKENLSTK
jgi:hypothetical protein